MGIPQDKPIRKSNIHLSFYLLLFKVVNPKSLCRISVGGCAVLAFLSHCFIRTARLLQLSLQVNLLDSNQRIQLKSPLRGRQTLLCAQYQSRRCLALACALLKIISVPGERIKLFLTLLLRGHLWSLRDDSDCVSKTEKEGEKSEWVGVVRY